MRVYYCGACGKRIPQEEIEQGQAFEAGGMMYCAQCAEAQVEIVDTEAAEAVPDGPVRCDKCKALIDPADIQNGNAVSTGIHSYCPKCTKMYLPLLQALEENGSLEESLEALHEAEALPEGPVRCDRCNSLIDPADFQSGKAVSASGQCYCAKCTAMYLPLVEALKEKEAPEEPVHHRRRTPAYGMHAVATERPSEARPPAFEKKSSALPILGIAAGVVVLIVILIVAMSGKPPAPPRGDTQPDDRHVVQPPEPLPFPDDRQETPKFAEDPRVKQAIEAADSFAEMNPNAYEAVISRYEQIQRSYSLSMSQDSHVTKAIDGIKQKRRHEAEAMRQKLLAKADELEKKGDYAGAIAGLNKYPDNYRAVEVCWNEIKARIDLLEKNMKASEPFELLELQVKTLKEQKKEEEAIAKLREFTKDHAGSSFALKAEQMIIPLEKLVKKRKEEKERLEKEKEEKLTAELETMENSDPLYYADFTSKDLKANIFIRYKDCQYPWDAGPGITALAVRRPNASMSFEFSLLEKPKHAQLDIYHIISTRDQGAGHLTLTIELNGKPIEKDRRFASGDAPLALEYKVADKLVKGKNKLNITQKGGNIGWVVEKIEMRGFYEGDGWEKEKKEANASAKTAISDYKKWLAEAEKGIEKAAKKLARKFERGALPALKPGTHDLLKSKSLKGWKMWGEGTQWKFEKGQLFCQNNVLGKKSSVLTTHYKNMHEWQDYELILKFSFENSSEHTIFLRTSYPADEKSVPGPCLACGSNADAFNSGREVEFKVTVNGDKANVFVDGKHSTVDHQIAPHLKKGFAGIELGQNVTVRIKEATLILKR